MEGREKRESKRERGREGGREREEREREEGREGGRGRERGGRLTLR